MIRPAPVRRMRALSLRTKPSSSSMTRSTRSRVFRSDHLEQVEDVQHRADRTFARLATWWTVIFMLLARVGRRHAPSTLSTLPVLLPDRRGEAKWRTASAMSSGRMLTPRVVRFAVVLLELVGLDAVRGRALLAPARVPDPRALQHGVGVDGVDSDAVRAPSSARRRARRTSAALTNGSAAACRRRARSWRPRRRSSRRGPVRA